MDKRGLKRYKSNLKDIAKKIIDCQPLSHVEKVSITSPGWHVELQVGTRSSDNSTVTPQDATIWEFAEANWGKNKFLVNIKGEKQKGNNFLKLIVKKR